MSPHSPGSHAAILAAGASTRLGGGRRKQLVEIEGEPLVRRAARFALEAGAVRVAVVLGAYAGDIEPALAGLAIDILDNPAWGEGMGSSVRVAAAWATAHAAPALLLAVCDQRALSIAHLAALLAADVAGDPVGSTYAGTIGVPAVFPASMFAALAAVTGDRGARDLLVGARAIQLTGGDRDVDTPADL